MSKRTTLEAFARAVDELKKIDPRYRLYVASDTLCLMDGESHDKHGRPQQHKVIASAGQLRISGGDW